MTNTNPTTGIRYGVIACQSLDGDVVHELFYGSSARDLSFEHAAEELRKGIEAEADEIEEEAREQAAIAAAERGAEDDAAREALEEQYLDSAFALYGDREGFIDHHTETRSDFEIEEPVIEGEYDGVKYRIDWLGGAPLLWVIEGPLGCAERLCSPCVPNAADLDGGFILEDEFNDPQHGEDYPCYVVPRDWLRKEHADR